MAADDAGNDSSAVSVPIGGLLAYAPYAAANVISDEDLGKSPLALPVAYKKLGLVKEDGAPQDGRNDEDPIKFWQKGYQLAGDGELSVQVNLAENNAAVNALIDGKEPDVNGIVYVDAGLPDARFIGLSVTKFKNGTEERKNGVWRVSAVEVDQDTRGSARGKSVTLTWLEDDLFGGAPYKKFSGTPTPVGA